jgi:prepilin-type N-terminal cleavage/methylation domain-containing protein
MRIFRQLTRRHPTRGRRVSQRHGLTLVELMLVSAVMAIVATTMAALATTVQVTSEQQAGRGTAFQHGQVAIERIERAILGATANDQFPGFTIISKSISGAAFPDTLVVWYPTGSAADPTGLPRVNELVVFTPSGGDPSQLIEIRSPGDARIVPPLANSSAWRTLIESLKMSAMPDMNSDAAVLTDLIRTAAVTNGDGVSLARRACIRFEQVLRPSAIDWASYQAGSSSWESLPWAQSIYGTTVGQRQALCRIELQLRPDDIESNDRQIAIPFLGSGAIYYQLER